MAPKNSEQSKKSQPAAEETKPNPETPTEETPTGNPDSSANPQPEASEKPAEEGQNASDQKESAETPDAPPADSGGESEATPDKAPEPTAAASEAQPLDVTGLDGNPEKQEGIWLPKATFEAVKRKFKEASEARDMWDARARAKEAYDLLNK